MGDGVMKYSLHRRKDGLFIATFKDGEMVGTLKEIREKLESIPHTVSDTGPTFRFRAPHIDWATTTAAPPRWRE
jgi:hypothetical protein